MDIIRELVGKQDRKAMNSNKELKGLLQKYLNRDKSPERKALLKEFKNGTH
jgi:hypothetical protein